MTGAVLIRMRSACRAGMIATALLCEADAVSGPSSATRDLIVCHAGSVKAAFAEVERAFAARYPAIALKDVSGGSVALAARLAAGAEACDVYATADYQTIELLLKPAGIADYTILFARGRIVLAYLATDRHTQGTAAPGAFNPPGSVPIAAPDWYRALLAPGVRIASSHPFLDPGGYRVHMVFQLAQIYYNAPNLANALLEHVVINASAPAAPASRPTLGRDFQFLFTYEHSAAAAAKDNPAYRYVILPDAIDLSTESNDLLYARASVSIPALEQSSRIRMVPIPATTVEWALTVPRRSANLKNALAFVGMLLGREGEAALEANGPVPITPASVSRPDYRRLPPAIRSLVEIRQK